MTRDDINTDHCVIRGDAFLCMPCGATYRPALPCPVDVFVATSNAFIDLHRHCKPRQEEPSDGL